MALRDDFPIWDQLTADEQAALAQAAVRRSAPQGAVLHSGASDCVGLFLILSGQLRAFILSPEGREITLYRLFERDVCLLSASCMIRSIQFEITVEAEKDLDVWVIPAEVYKKLMAQSAAVANYTNQIMASRFSEVMWLVDQIMWKSVDRRLAAFLLGESVLEESPVLNITHDRIAAHLGTAREVVTRMLRYFQSEGLVALGRGRIELTDPKGLQALSE